jgi:hypothetical protein
VTLPPSYFDDMYRAAADPWGFVDRPYEARKRALTLASLPDRRYALAFEAGCSIGVLSAELAERCDRLIAMDVSDAALATARTRVPTNVDLIRGSVPADWPADHVSLAVLSEVGYYLDDDGCHALMTRALEGADTVLAVHWRHPVVDYPISGDAVHRILTDAAGDAGWTKLAGHTEADFLLDIWSADGRSVARRTGLRS